MENCPFKPGDKLVCIRDGGWAEELKFLVEGQTYTFSQNDSTSPDIFVEGSDFSWRGDRFQLAPEAKPLPYKEAFEAGVQVGRLEGLVEALQLLGGGVGPLVQEPDPVDDSGPFEKLNAGDKVICVDPKGQSFQLIKDKVYTVSEQGGSELSLSQDKYALIALNETPNGAAKDGGSFRFRFRKLTGRRS